MIFLSIHPEASLSCTDSHWHITLNRYRRPLPNEDAYEPMWKRLQSGGDNEDALLALVPPIYMPQVSYLLSFLVAKGYLLATIQLSDGEEFATLWSHGEGYSDTPPLSGTFSLSRFALMRVDDGAMVIETPRSRARVKLHHPLAAAFVSMLSLSRSLDDITRMIGVSLSTGRLFISFLYQAQMLEEPAMADQSSTHYWSFHDLLFHTSSRVGQRVAPYGATFPFKDREPMPPMVKPSMSAQAIPLHIPNLQRVIEDDYSLTAVLENRVSVRMHNHEAPITVKQLGEFLYRTARIRAIYNDPNLPYAVASRPYPGGGACYELELYIVANHCAGLENGVYHYEPLAHQLAQLTIEDEEAHRHSLNQLVEQAMQVSNEPQLVVLIAARLPRLAWKYESVVYSLILKHVGVLIQTMYLVATAMDLAPCAVGGGDIHLFSKLTATDPFVEPGVGEFVLGSR